MENFTSQDKDLSEILEPYLRKWKFFLVSLVFILGLAYLYLRYATPTYLAESKLQILEEKNATSELSALREIDILGGGKTNVDDEIEVLNSRSNFIEVVQDLGLNVRFMEIGRVKSTEVYFDRPFKINFIENDSAIIRSTMDFTVELLSDTEYLFQNTETGFSRRTSFGENIATKEVGDIVLTPNQDIISDLIGRQYAIAIRPVFKVAEDYKDKLIVTKSEEFSNILILNIEDPIKKKAKDILDQLILTFNQNAISDKKEIADRTSEFINDRIAEFSTELNTVDQTAEDYKTSTGLADLQSESNIALNIGAQSRQELETSRTELNIVSSMKSYVDEQEQFDVLPSNIGLTDPTIANITAKYNELVLERKRLMKSADERNPVIVNLDQQLRGLQSSLRSSLEGMEQNMALKVNSLTQQLSRINSKIYSAPSKERALRDITRQQQTTESLYLYLLTKREESQITFASSEAKSKVIDEAYIVGDGPISPNRMKIYLTAFIVGLLLPTGLIYTRRLLDNKVQNMNSLEGISKDGLAAVLGELPKIDKKGDLLIKKNDRSILAESFRILRTNLDYLIKSNTHSEGPKNIIYITSTVPGEGKTFVTTNMAISLASAGKKVLVVGADVRNPKLDDYFKKLKNSSGKRKFRKIGLTDYLIDNQIGISEIINPITVQEIDFDIVFSGLIPPNPAELLMSDGFGTLMNSLAEKYDYVLVDTAPLMVVSDTLYISKHASHIIYVLRSGVTHNKAIEFPLKLSREGKINGLAFLVNGVSQQDLGYGGKYGYGYG